MTQPTQPKASSQLQDMISTFVNDLLWRVVQCAIKAALVMFFWNGLIAPLFPLPAFAFGNAFALVAIVAVLFSNLNGYSKFQTRHLFDLKSLVYQLIVNQHTQNTIIMSLLSRPAGQSDKNEKKMSQKPIKRLTGMKRVTIIHRSRRTSNESQQERPSA